MLQELTPVLLQLAQAAQTYQLNLTIDAEESERLDLSLDVMEKIISDPSLKDWHGFGFALQSYQKRAFEILDWVTLMSRTPQTPHGAPHQGRLLGQRNQKNANVRVI